MRTISTCVAVEVCPTPFQLASVFWDMDAEEQAEFFNAIGNIVRATGGSFPTQLQNVTDSPKLQSAGRYVMRTIGNYADEAGVA